ncbi:MAG: sulfite exporter TauE/SafE family protein [Nocardiopsaceae bacterium]|nr:sulfite exporter TauE/SafE family protein [Nocardiopsaceae bacterium]
MLLSTTLLVITVVFLASLVRATFGFGEAVVGMPLLALLPLDLHTAISLIGLAGLTVAVLATATGWRHVDRPALLRLAAATAVGIPVGLGLVTLAPAAVVTAALGAFLVGYGGYSLIRPALPRITAPTWALPFGFAAGMLGSAYNLNGVPVVVYGSLYRWNPETFRNTLQAHFLVSGVFVVAGQALGGLWAPPLLSLYGLAVPAIVAATVLGTIVHKHIPAERFQQSVYAVVLVLGALLLLTSFRG